jgi:hypothetical protein
MSKPKLPKKFLRGTSIEDIETALEQAFPLTWEAIADDTENSIKGEKPKVRITPKWVAAVCLDYIHLYGKLKPVELMIWEKRAGNYYDKLISLGSSVMRGRV